MHVQAWKGVFPIRGGWVTILLYKYSLGAHDSKPVKGLPLPPFDRVAVVTPHSLKHQFMFSRVLLTILLAGTAFCAFGQVTFEQVMGLGERVRQDSAAYVRLAERFAAGDSTLTHEELAMLYYGSAFMPDYDPYQEERIIEAADALARRDRPWDARRLLDHFLEKNPASLRALLDKAYLSWVTNDSAAIPANYFRYYQMLSVPLKSGDGLSPETAIIVRSIQDEELVLNQLDRVALAKSIQTIGNLTYHVVSTAPEKKLDKRTDYYFIIELPLKLGKQKNIDAGKNGN